MKNMLISIIVVLASICLFTSNVSASGNVEKSGDELLEKLANYNHVMNTGNIYDLDQVYDDFTRQIKIVENEIGQVPGAKNRKRLNETFIKPSKIAVERTIYEVSQFRLLEDIRNLLDEGAREKALLETDKLERLKRRANAIKATGGYKDVPYNINMSLRIEEVASQIQIINLYYAHITRDIHEGNLKNLNNYTYDNFTSQLRRLEAKIGQVPNAQSRFELNNTTVKYYKIPVERTIYELSLYRLLQDVDYLITQNRLDQAREKFDLTLINRLKRRAFEIKKAGGYEELPMSINEEIEDYQATIQQKLDAIR